MANSIFLGLGCGQRQSAGCLSLIIPLLLVTCAGQAVVGDDISVWAAGCTEKIQDQKRSALPHDVVWDAATKTVRLEAVRGEHVPFQIVISTDQRHLNGIQLSPARFVSEENEIDQANINLFLLPLVNVYAATQDHGSSGRWPDAMVPLVEPFDMRFYWHSQKINQQSVWVDIWVPGEQPAGIYRGSIDISVGSAQLDRIEVEMVVHDICLPQQRNFPVHIGLYENQIARVHGVDQDSLAFKQIFAGYLNYLLDNRCDPRTSPGFRGQTKNGDYVLHTNSPHLEKLFLEKGRLQFWISPVPEGVTRPGQVPFPNAYQNSVRRHLQQVIQHAKKSGWYSKLGFHVPVDEPKSADDYAAVREWAKLIKSVDENVPVAVTEQPKPENSQWGSLTEHVDSWIINGNYLFTDRESIEQRREKGDQVFWYVSCDQLYPQPNLYIDREAADPRMIPWIAWQYQLSGFLYWNATYWGEVLNPWRDPVTWKTLPCNLPASGEGSLFYPGNMVKQFSSQPNVEGPVGSLRLQLLREGLEERELLQMLARKIGRNEVEKIISPVCTDIRTFSRDPNQVDKVRKQVIQKLLDIQRTQSTEKVGKHP